MQEQKERSEGKERFLLPLRGKQLIGGLKPAGKG
jgi:hypothetical protein